MRECPNCGSIWVCWNLIHSTKDSMNELNPDRVFLTDQWYHDCWDCENVFETSEEVFNGIEYEKLVNLWVDKNASK